MMTDSANSEVSTATSVVAVGEALTSFVAERKRQFVDDEGR